MHARCATGLHSQGRGASVGTFRDAAAYGDLVINALSGAVSLEVLRAVGEEHLDKVFGALQFGYHAANVIAGALGAGASPALAAG